MYVSDSYRARAGRRPRYGQTSSPRLPHGRELATVTIRIAPRCRGGDDLRQTTRPGVTQAASSFSSASRSVPGRRRTRRGTSTDITSRRTGRIRRGVRSTGERSVGRPSSRSARVSKAATAFPGDEADRYALEPGRGVRRGVSRSGRAEGRRRALLVEHHGRQLLPRRARAECHRAGRGQAVASSVPRPPCAAAFSRTASADDSCPSQRRSTATSRSSYDFRVAGSTRSSSWRPEGVSSHAGSGRGRRRGGSRMSSAGSVASTLRVTRAGNPGRFAVVVEALTGNERGVASCGGRGADQGDPALPPLRRGLPCRPVCPPSGKDGKKSE